MITIIQLVTIAILLILIFQYENLGCTKYFIQLTVATAQVLDEALPLLLTAVLI